MRTRGRCLTIVVLAPLLLLVARADAAQDITIGPTPTPQSMPPGGASYTDPTYGWTLAYDASWTVVEEGPSRFVLTNGVSTFTFSAPTHYGDDAVACLAGAAGALASDSANTGVAAATGPDGAPVRGEDAAAERVWAVYLLTRQGEGLAVYLDCRKLLRGQAVLLIAQETPAGSFNDENEPRQALLAGLTLPVDPCTAIEGFRAATVARLDQASEEIRVIAFSSSAGSFREAAETIRSLQSAQESAIVPPGLEAVQRLAVEALDQFARQAELTAESSEALEKGDFTRSIDLLDQSFAAGVEAVAASEEAKDEIDRLAAGCAEAGVDGPAVNPAPTTAADGSREWPCPPDQTKIDDWRESAQELRETASESTSLTNKQGLLAQADQWDALADEWLAYCAASPST